MKDLLEKAKAAHAEHHVKRVSHETETCNGLLQKAVKDILGLDLEAAGNRATHEKIVFTCHTDGKLHVLHRCGKCGFEYRSFHHIRPGEHALVDLHNAATEPHRSHPPCNGARFVKEAPPETLAVEAVP